MIKVFEAFSGYGSQSLALERLNIEHEVVCISEIDKYAIQAYEAIHGKILNLGDISKIKVENVPDHDLFTYSFPCQDISNAGNQKGIIKGQTRSGLLWECERIIESKKPKYLLMENVKNLVSKKFKNDFDKWCEKLESIGYTNYWKVINAKDYGIPQNRERVFMISILGEHKQYEFPDIFDSRLRLKDMLEEKVEEKYYLSKEYVERFVESTKKDKYPMGNAYKVLGSTVGTGEGTNSRHWVYDTNSNISTLDATMYKQPKQILQVWNYREKDKGFKNPQTGRVYSSEGLSPTLNTMQGGDRQPKVLVREATKKGYTIARPGDSINLEQPNSKTRRGRVGNEVANTLTTSCNQGTILDDLRIRKLTPRECFRLMGLKDNEIDKIQATGISNSQQYKMAGNSIVVNVLEAIFRNLFLK